MDLAHKSVDSCSLPPLSTKKDKAEDKETNVSQRQEASECSAHLSLLAQIAAGKSGTCTAKPKSYTPIQASHRSCLGIKHEIPASLEHASINEAVGKCKELPKKATEKASNTAEVGECQPNEHPVKVLQETKGSPEGTPFI